MKIPRILLSLIPLFALLCSPLTRAADVIQIQPFTNGTVEVDVNAADGRQKRKDSETPIKVWVTPEEKAAIAAKADAHSLSASGYVPPARPGAAC
jgi:hypothetical protein